MSKKTGSRLVISKFTKILIGLIITFLFMSIFGFPGYNFIGYSTGWGDWQSGFSNAYGFILMSIVCTAGISLVLWIPLWYGVGIIVFWLIDYFTMSNGDTTKKDQVTNENKALINYIHQARKQHLKDEAILGLLMMNGWSEHDIKKGFEEAKIED